MEVAAKKNTEIAGSAAEKYFCRIAVAVVEKTTAAETTVVVEDLNEAEIAVEETVTAAYLLCEDAESFEEEVVVQVAGATGLVENQKRSVE